MEQNHNQGGSHQQHVKAGQQSHKNTGKHASKSDDNKQNVSSSPSGSHELHVKAGQQSHKNS
ncbi:hypothetical protein A8A54_22605 [Brucella pseudogrignonensis]|uniref:hypothetical protein n=1 Tax=Brucella pseudogrignonensis TaxID=419475 RepID=UPI0007DA498E|nr:hypothetical protein [Brucella pseudogrignonensis]ANG99326.1 hypothetical protein A8A54_22605 [Brucella pseudogrignonensis]